jgi:hypothetical protein
MSLEDVLAALLFVACAVGAVVIGLWSVDR